MATLPITSGNINLTDVASFFNVTGNTNLADYTRGGGIVPPTGPAVFPATGGIALTGITNTIRLLHETGSDTGWPNDAGVIEGASTGWTYTPNTTAVVAGRNSGGLNNRLINGTGAALNVVNWRIDMDYTIANIDPNDDPADLRINMFARLVDANGSESSLTERFRFNAGAGEVSVGANSTQLVLQDSFTIPNGSGLGFYVTETTNEEGIPYDFTIQAVRISFSATEFVRVAPAINTGISETVNGLNLNQFYGVDDGEA